ncbi:MAG TPA: anhydro-N-acetylmuramic acid kinase [Chitinophagaceae bacterium]
MFYRAIGLMSGSSMDGLDIVFAEFTETGGQWSYEIKAAECYSFSDEWAQQLRNAATLGACDYLLLHTAFGKYLGEQVNRFITANKLHHQVQLIASHGHTVFHAPARGMTAQLGDGAAIAAETGINVVSDLRAMDVALGGQGAPIVPVGEKLLFSQFPLLLNIGGIANISIRSAVRYIAFDICPANRVLNLLAARAGKSYDDQGQIAASGEVRPELLTRLNELPYYAQPYPKSLPNQFGTDVVFPMLAAEKTKDALATYVQHIARQVRNAIEPLLSVLPQNCQLLVTGGGAYNSHLVKSISAELQPFGIEVIVPEKRIIEYKEALVMALLGVLRWREQNTVLASVTGARRDSIGGAVWVGQEA